ncbi:MAG: phosphoribosyltransferase family protein [Spirochaetes bacterium]|nr:phosphoribosyltransferase family protein [Spirochaetota bacterium]
MAYKFKGMFPLATMLGEMLTREARARWPGATVVPVPPRAAAVRERGWDPVLRLCTTMKHSGLDVRPLLVRENGVAQKTLDYAHRLTNMTGMVSLRQGPSVPLALVLVDDVMTTGATLSECARVLKEAGARSVGALVIAAD